MLKINDDGSVGLSAFVSGKVESFTDRSTNQNIQLGEGSSYQGKISCVLEANEIKRISENATKDFHLLSSDERLFRFNQDLNSFDFNFETDFK